MQFTNLSFIIIFLPLSLIIYWVCPSKLFKDFFLLILNLTFYSLGSIHFLPVFILSIIINIIIGRIMNKVNNSSIRILLLLVGIAFNLSLLAYYKYGNDFISILNKYIYNNSIGIYILQPLGISFFIFKSISYLVDIYKKKITLDTNPIHDIVYLSFFTQIQSGPIARYSEMQPINDKSEKRSLFHQGIYRFIVGVNKKILIADILGLITSEIFASNIDGMSSIYAWFGSICYSLQIYYDFSSYSDMAIGISNMFGFNINENFNFPYLTKSVSEFWRRWHISLSNWFKDYIYIPLGGSRNKNKNRVFFNLLIVWIATGVWHGLKKHFIAWALGFFIVISFEKMTGLPNKLHNTLSKFIYRIFTLLFINISWVIFKMDSLRLGLKYVINMFSFNNNAIQNIRTKVLLKDYFIIIVFAIILCFPISSFISKKIKNNRTTYFIYKCICCTFISLCFIWSISFIINGQYNPFTYANF